MAATARAGGTLGAFVLAWMAAVAMLFVGVVVTAGMSEHLSARAAGDALLWMGAGQLALVAGFVALFRGLARRWSGAAPAWWVQLALGVLIAAAAAVLFLVAMILMNR